MRDVLEDAGLSSNEAKTYVGLLRAEQATASALAKQVGLHRSTAYLQLDNLAEKGLVSYHVKDNKRYYQAAPPQKLVDRLESKKDRVEAVLPQLEDLAPTPDVFQTEVFEAKEGVKTFYEDVLRRAGTVRAFGVTGRAYETLQYVFPSFVEECEDAGVTARYLANPDAERYLDRLPSGMVDIKYVESAHSAVTTVIYADTVAIQSLQEDNVFVVKIDDEALSEGYASYFDYMWACADAAD